VAAARPTGLGRGSSINGWRPSHPLYMEGGDYSAAELEFIHAIEVWQNKHAIKFPLWSDVLAILLSLGYKK
jgi:hypothetical protein